MPDYPIDPLSGMPEPTAERRNARWPAAWCRCPEAPRHESAVSLFRRVLTLETVPETFVVHVTGDQRYRLSVNGEAMCWGPARGDTKHWRYETVDIAPQLKIGENVIAAIVHYFDDNTAPWAQMTAEAGFLMQGATDAEAAVNTPTGWKSKRDDAYSFSLDDARSLWTYVVVGPSEHLDCRKHPWGWRSPGFDDSEWETPTVIGRPYAAPHGIEDAESSWWLVPRPIPAMEETPTAIGRVVRASGFVVTNPDAFPLVIPPHTRAAVLFDYGQETCAFPIFAVAGGREATIRLSYAEALVDGNLKPNDPHRKENRNVTEGRVLHGYADYWILDGEARSLRPIWWKTFRYAELTVETQDEELIIGDLQAVYTGYPFREKAAFDAPELLDAAKIWEVSWRTIRLCAHETYMDCPYYEQLQYAGDTRIQALVSLYVSGDSRLFRNALKQLDESRLPEGLTQSRYPARMAQVIAPFSLWWIGMIDDYWRHVPGDDAFLRGLLPGVRAVNGWFGDRMGDDGLLGRLQWWGFADWVPAWRFGVAPGALEGGSAILSLQYALALREQADLEESHGRAKDAAGLRDAANALAAAVREICYDPATHRVADTPAHQTFSQHAAILAILADAIPEYDRISLMERTLTDPDLQQATFYFRFYLNRALVKSGLGDRYLETLGPWRDMLAAGLTTWAENPEPARSDCHAWSASPAYEFLTTVLGILPDAPGFARVRLAPNLGNLTQASGKIPHPSGEIAVSYRRAGDALTAEIALPEGVGGVLAWKGKETPLSGGKQTVTLGGASAALG